MTCNREELHDLVPLYVNRTLTGQELEAFETCLADDETLQEEVREFEEIAGLYQSITAETPIPSTHLYQRILANIGPASVPRPAEGILSTVRDWLSTGFASPRVAWAVAGVQCAVILLMLGGLFTSEYTFRTLSSREGPPAGEVSVNLVFLGNATENEIREMLNRLGARIVDGPSREGLYVVRVRIGEEEKSEEVLEALRAEKLVAFAESRY